MEEFSRRQVVRWGAEGIVWYVLIALVLLAVVWVIALAAFGMRVATAGIIGAGNAHIQNESAGNRVVQQAGFEMAWADIRKYDQQVKDASAAVTDWDKANGAKPDNAIGTLAGQRTYLTQTRAGIKQQCQTTVESYNADARKILAMDWRSKDLPQQIDLSEHCK